MQNQKSDWETLKTWFVSQRRRSFKNQSVRGRVNGVLLLQSDQRGVLLISVGSLVPLLGVQALKSPGC